MLTRTSETIIDTDCRGLSALEYLARRFTYHDRQRWQAECHAGRVLINGNVTDGTCQLRPGDALQYLPEPRPEPPVDLHSTLIYDGGDFAVFNKSGNLPCHPAGCFFNHTLWAQLKEGTVPGTHAHEQIHFVSRLDRETSGLVLVAWSKEALRDLSHALTAPEAQKAYRVLVEGAFPAELAASGWLWSSPDATIRKQRFFSPERPPLNAIRPETAATRFRLVARHGDLSEVEAILETGRTHQIRATLKSLGFPVVGDKLYGVDSTLFLRFIDGTLTDRDRQLLRMRRQALHAHRLVLPLPQRPQPLEITAPLPEDFRPFLG